MQFTRSRAVRALLPTTLALAFLVAPLAGGGGYFGKNGRVIYVEAPDVKADGAVIAPQCVGGPAATGPGASLSPNGAKIAYTTAAGVRVHVIGSACGADYDLPALSSEPAWSPDGATIAYVSGNRIFTIAADGTGTPTARTPAATVSASPTWSPDGTAIAFASQRGGHYEIWKVTLATGAQSQITVASGAEDLQPAWSPDGTRIAFHSNRSGVGVNEIYVVSAAGGTLTQLTSDGLSQTAPVWSPDSSTITFARSGAGPASDGIYTVPAAGGPVSPRRVAATGAETADWETLVPTNTTAPTVSSSDPPVQGQSVTATTGTWDGASSYSYQWRRCAADGTGCTDSGSPTSSSSYTLTSGDVGLRIRVVVTASNTAGPGTPAESSNLTGVVIGPGPTNTTLPSISGAARVGNTLSASIGTWTGSGNTYTYQWKKCSPTTTSCFDLPGQTSSFFTITSDLFGWQVRVMVTARNADGSASANSPPTGTVVADPPVNTFRPTISGLNIVGETLFAGTGTWTGTLPITYTYQWKRCNPQGAPTSCAPIAGATSSTYVLTASDSGVTVRVYVTAHNAAADVEAFSDHTFPTLPVGDTSKTTQGRPASSALPRIVGTPTTGATLTANAGTWTGQAPIAYRYAWRRCDATGAACKRVAGATRTTYRVRAADVGFTLRVAVVARNAVGATTALSAPSDTVQLSKPVPRGRHLVGTRKADYLPGGGGNDFIEGRAGNDTLLGGAGNDRLVAGPGNDVVDGGPGADRIDAGPGSDTVRAADGTRDQIDCGDGRDHAVVDRDDVVTGCELVTFGTTPTTTPAP